MEWRPIAGEPGYEVSDSGVVRSIERLMTIRTRWGGEALRPVRGRVLKPWCGNSAYALVYLNDRRAALVHRLVAHAFLEPVPGKEFVNHRDGNKANNAAANLEWCTSVENMAHALQTGLVTQRAVVATPKAGGAGLAFANSRAAAVALGGISKWGNIKSALCGLAPSAYGFTWAYADQA